MQASTSVWSKTYEGIMFKLVALCVELRRPIALKESLHRYRALCGPANVQSLEVVLMHAVQLTEQAIEAARAHAADNYQAGAVTVTDQVHMNGDKANDDDEEASVEEAEAEEEEELGGTEDEDTQPHWGAEMPANLLLEASGMSTSRSRTDRQLLVPTLLFAWEVFRTALDISKNSPRLETCYYEVAKRAFAFASKFQRAAEFRRLCDLLRQHLTSLLRYPARVGTPEVQLSNPATMQRFLEVRFLQLDGAIQMENWQEAYRTVEDVHELFSLNKRPPPREMMMHYYDKLATIFWVADNYLLHALALYRLWVLQAGNREGATTEAIAELAHRLVAATLCVPCSEHSLQAPYLDVFMEPAAVTHGEATRHAKMLALLGWPAPATAMAGTSSKAANGQVAPTSRPWLMQELVAQDVLAVCVAPLQRLFQEVAADEDAIDMPTPSRFSGTAGALGEAVQALTAYASESTEGAAAPADVRRALQPYLQPLHRAAIGGILARVCALYASIRLERLLALMSFMPAAEAQRVALEYIKADRLGLRLDYRAGCAVVEQPPHELEAVGNAAAVLSARLREGMKWVTGRQPVADSAEERQLACLADRTDAVRVETEGRQARERRQQLEAAEADAEARAEHIEREERRQAQLEEARAVERQKRRAAEEAQRREVEQIRREMEEREQQEIRRLQAEMEARKRAGVSAAVAAAGLSVNAPTPGSLRGDAPADWSADALLGIAGGGSGDDAAPVGPDGTKLSRQDILLRQQQEQLTQRRELAQKLSGLARRLDYMDRALHERQAPKLEAHHREVTAQIIERRRSAAAKRIEQLREQYERDRAEKQRLEPVFLSAVYRDAVQRIRHEAERRAHEDRLRRERRQREQAQEREREKEQMDAVAHEEAPAPAPPPPSSARAPETPASTGIGRPDGAAAERPPPPPPPTAPPSAASRGYVPPHLRRAQAPPSDTRQPPPAVRRNVGFGFGAQRGA
ncbi:hypothetical protein CDCA_CDCA19G4663 [Cyanidium caldarium]|uniref:eIF3a PCI domain-containing protein n=1 Tax=Cyanidium caldarium TaxID=2771 RepID=A0AAV9J3N6_CYACA|nr:hypothetical protein CDCA_CDCA19G4663 [Cyanidium caldarium]